MIDTILLYAKGDQGLTQILERCEARFSLLHNKKLFDSRPGSYPVKMTARENRSPSVLVGGLEAGSKHNYRQKHPATTRTAVYFSHNLRADMKPK